MKMKIKVKGKTFKFKGEVGKLCKIIEILKSMNQDEQVRTLTYLSSRLRDNYSI